MLPRRDGDQVVPAARVGKPRTRREGCARGVDEGKMGKSDSAEDLGQHTLRSRVLRGVR